ncbi:unnamed protein product [Symbiodinium pilosum]|uniref:Nucleotide-diphospho-sugar transferase n=1 Tax=Symbiodinium pilosum TaxID=2952 RepID=A0A812LYD9_SYMPI|nr:unnamed protein product [Symbiodinium pilosum]
MSRRWLPAKLLHELSIKQVHLEAEEPSEHCIILIYTFPTEEIRRDVKSALESLQTHFVDALGSEPRLVVFVDAQSEHLLDQDVRPFTRLRITPAVIPEQELRRPMRSYSCQRGEVCTSGNEELELAMDAHRGKVNETQYWSPTYLRISRYTAGPLFLHPALDSCTHFLKIDTDFFFTEPLQWDPIRYMKNSGLRLGYWQIHVQGQRQEGYIEAAMSFLKEQQLPIRNMRFHARGQFEEKARKLQIPLESVPVADQASTVLYGCLFGGDTRFFREPLYQSFFEYMDKQQGFETYGWSNQFFLGTAAAAFLAPCEVSRLYVSGVHQDSSINISRSGHLIEFLLGASHGFMR